MTNLRLTGISILLACGLNACSEPTEDQSSRAPKNSFDDRYDAGLNLSEVKGKTSYIESKDIKNLLAVKMPFIRVFSFKDQSIQPLYNLSRASAYLKQEPTFKTCVDLQISNSGITKSSTSISQSFDLDLIKDCDENAKKDDRKDFIDTVSNSIKVDSIVNCSQELKGKEGTCDGVSSLSTNPGPLSGNVISSGASSARMTIKTVNEDGKDIKIVQLIADQQSVIISNDGFPCEITKNNLVTTISRCTMKGYSFEFSGEPKFENSDPFPAKIEHAIPKVLRYEITLNNVELKDGEPHFRSGTVDFTINNWSGKITYQGSGFKNPLLTATSKVTGKLANDKFDDARLEEQQLEMPKTKTTVEAPAHN